MLAAENRHPDIAEMLLKYEQISVNQIIWLKNVQNKIWQKFFLKKLKIFFCFFFAKMVKIRPFYYL